MDYNKVVTLNNTPDIEYFRNNPLDDDDDEYNIAYYQDINDLLRDDINDGENLRIFHADYIRHHIAQLSDSNQWSDTNNCTKKSARL